MFLFANLLVSVLLAIARTRIAQTHMMLYDYLPLPTCTFLLHGLSYICGSNMLPAPPASQSRLAGKDADPFSMHAADEDGGLLNLHAESNQSFSPFPLHTSLIFPINIDITQSKNMNMSVSPIGSDDWVCPAYMNLSDESMPFETLNTDQPVADIILPPVFELSSFHVLETDVSLPVVQSYVRCIAFPLVDGFYGGCMITDQAPLDSSTTDIVVSHRSSSTDLMVAPNFDCMVALIPNGFIIECHMVSSVSFSSEGPVVTLFDNTSNLPPITHLDLPTTMVYHASDREVLLLEHAPPLIPYWESWRQCLAAFFESCCKTCDEFMILFAKTISIIILLGTCIIVSSMSLSLILATCIIFEIVAIVLMATVLLPLTFVIFTFRKHWSSIVYHASLATDYIIVIIQLVWEYLTGQDSDAVITSSRRRKKKKLVKKNSPIRRQFPAEKSPLAVKIPADKNISMKTQNFAKEPTQMNEQDCFSNIAEEIMQSICRPEDELHLEGRSMHCDI